MTVLSHLYFSSMQPKYVSVVGLFLWGQFPQGLNLPYCYPYPLSPETIFSGQVKATS